MSQEFLSGNRQYWSKLRALPIVSFLSCLWVGVYCEKTLFHGFLHGGKKCWELFYGVELVRIFNHLRCGPVRTVILLKVCIKHNMLVKNLHNDGKKIWRTRDNGVRQNIRIRSHSSVETDRQSEVSILELKLFALELEWQSNKKYVLLRGALRALTLWTWE